MGRRQSNTVDYFPHFAEQGKTLFILKSRFGNDGYAFWFQLLEILCKEENHCYDFSDDTAWQYLLAKTGVNEITGTEILRILANLEKLDREMLNRKVLWCENLVQNLKNVYQKRGRATPVKPIPVSESTESGAETTESGAEIPQSKVKYSKVKDSRDTPEKKGWGEFQNVLLTDEEFQKLHDRFNKETSALIERLSTYIASTGKRYKSHYATLLSWKQRDDKEGKSGKTGHWPRELPKKYTEPPDYGDD